MKKMTLGLLCAWLVIMILFGAPQAAAAVVLKLGDILVVEPTGVVSVIDPSTGAKTVIAQGGLLQSSFKTVGVALTPDGDVIVVRRDLGLIRVNPLTGSQIILSQNSTDPPDPLPFLDPWAIAIDNVTGYIYVADSGYDNDRPEINVGAGRIIRVHPVSGARELIAAGNSCDVFPLGVACQNTTTAGSYLAHPYGIAIDYSTAPATLIVADMSSFNGKGAIIRIQAVPNGAQTLVWGPATASPPPQVAQLSPLGCPMGVAVEPNGNILTAVFTYPLPSTPTVPPPAGTFYGCAAPGIFRLDLTNNVQAVVNTNAPRWQPGHAYAVGDVIFDEIIFDEILPGHVHRVTTAGISGSSTPGWAGAPAGTTMDGSVAWQNIGLGANWLIPFGLAVEPAPTASDPLRYNILVPDEGYGMVFRLDDDGHFLAPVPLAANLGPLPSLHVITVAPPVPPDQPPVAVTSSFGGTETPLNEGGMWDSPGSWADLQKNGGAFAIGLNALARLVAPAVAADQYAEITYDQDPGASSWVGVATRIQGASNGSGYLAIVFAGEVRLYRTDDTGSLNFTLLASAGAATGAAPRKLRLESEGNVHRVYFNDVLMITHLATAPIYASGQPGIAASVLVFGGPQVKILSFAGGTLVIDVAPPVRSNGLPTGTLPTGTTQTTLRVTTNEAATCRYSTQPGVTYASMTNTFTTTGTTTHSTDLSGLANNQSYWFYVRCADGAGNANTDDFLIAFSVGSTVAATSNFVGTEDPLSEDGKWNSPGPWTDLQKDNGAYAIGLNAQARLVTPLVAADQYAEITYDQDPGPDGSWVGVATRSHATNGTGYLAIVYAGEVRLYRTDNSGGLQFKLLASAGADIGAAPRKLRLESQSQGNVHRVYFNGLLMFSHIATAPIYTTGQPGLAASVWDGPQVKILSFEGGSLGATGDITPPETTITGSPAALTNATSATFTFSNFSTGLNEPGSTFQCRLDAATFAACTSPRTLSGLAAGSHTFEVRAIDSSGNVDPSPASFSWVIDRTAPSILSLTSTPSNTPTNVTTRSFTFTSNDPAATFQCRLDGAAFAPCTSPQGYPVLTNGNHTFRVRAIDPAGNVGAIALHSWNVDTSAPNTTITVKPPAVTTSTSATFEFTANQAGSGFACSLDGAAFTPCTSPTTYPGLVAGSHNFGVRATDLAGNTDPTPALFSWTIQ